MNAEYRNAFSAALQTLGGPPADSFPLLDLAEGATLIRDETAPLLYAVWFDDDIIGAADDSETAVAEARATLTAWGLIKA